VPFYTYILARKRNGTLYIGVTNDIARRIAEHREGKGSSFTGRYSVHRLVYAEVHDSVTTAIHREKLLKEWPRAWKIRQIEKDNPNWDDLYDTLI